MPALSYNGRFCEYVENGLKPKIKKGDRVKRQTIRNTRKRPFPVGDKLYHYYAMRTTNCKKLGESICMEAPDITITQIEILITSPDTGLWKVINKKAELDAFAYADGFDDWDQMKRWWIITHGVSCFPFHGQLIKW